MNIIVRIIILLFTIKIYNKSNVLNLVNMPFKRAYSKLLNSSQIAPLNVNNQTGSKKIKDWVIYSLTFLLFLYSTHTIFSTLYNNINLQDILYSLKLGLITSVRIIIVMILTLVICIPLGIYIGLHPKLLKFAQPLALICASFPANLLFPIAVITIKKYSLNPDIWLSVLILISILWYILFNTLYGMDSIPKNLMEVSRNFNIRGYKFLSKIILPSLLPSILIGAITAWGCAWNTTVVAELVEWGNTKFAAAGIGSYVTIATNEGDTSKIMLGILVMILYIEIFNKLIWRPLFKYANQIEALK